MARIGLIQFDILWENVDGNVEKVGNLLADAGHANYDLLVLPELWTCGFTMNHEAHKTRDAGLAAMKAFSKDYGCAVLGGLPAKTETGQENRCYLVQEDEEKHYAKIKAFKYAGEHLKYEQGSQSQRWDVAGFKLSPFVCYDLRFPELARNTIPQSNLISYVANWPSTRNHHWRHLLVARAIENLCFVIGVNRVGRDGAGLDYLGSSMVVAPNGDLVLDAGDVEGVHVAEVDPSDVAKLRKSFPFLDDI